MKHLRALLAAGSLVTIGMLTGRLLGLLREMTLAAQFGTGPKADMAVALLLIPDVITTTFVGLVVGAALIPAFTERSAERARALFWQVLLLTVAKRSLCFASANATCAWWCSI